MELTRSLLEEVDAAVIVTDHRVVDYALLGKHAKIVIDSRNAMASVRKHLRREGLQALMVNCVHDEILVEAPEGDAWDVSEIVREEMVAAGERYIKRVPIVVDVSVGDSWQK